MRYALFAAIFAFILSACTTQKKPSDWELPAPEQEKAERKKEPFFSFFMKKEKTDATQRDCSRIAGTYSNKGEDTKGNKYLLAMLLKPRVEANTTNARIAEHEMKEIATYADTVELFIEENDSLLHIKAMGDGFGQEWSHQFSCDSQTLKISLTGKTSEPNYSRFTVGELNLLRTESHLVIEQHNVFIGLKKAIPKGQYENIWFRFPVHTPPVKIVHTRTQSQDQADTHVTTHGQTAIGNPIIQPATATVPQIRATTAKEPSSSALHKTKGGVPPGTKEEPKPPQKGIVQ